MRLNAAFRNNAVKQGCSVTEVPGGHRSRHCIAKLRRVGGIGRGQRAASGYGLPAARRAGTGIYHRPPGTVTRRVSFTNPGSVKVASKLPSGRSVDLKLAGLVGDRLPRLGENPL